MSSNRGSFGPARVLALTVLLVSLGGRAWGGETARASASRSLLLRSGTVATAEADNLLPQIPAVHEPGRRYVIQLDGPMTPERRQALEQAGVRLGDYLPTHAYIVELDPARLDKFAQLGFVVWMGQFRDEWKIDPRLAARRLSSARGRTPAEPEPASAVVLTLFAGEDPGEVLATLRSGGAEVIGHTQVGNQWIIQALLPANEAYPLAQNPAVQCIEPVGDLAKRNDSNAWITQSNTVGQTPVWDAGLGGEGQITGLIDTGLDPSHCAFDDGIPVGPGHRKLVAVRGAALVNYHGTNVAGSLAGDEPPLGLPNDYDGMAPASRISLTDFEWIRAAPTYFYTAMGEAHADGAHVHSNSWGDDTTTDYTVLCQIIDQFSYEHEDDLVVFAITNLSDLKSPENAKNVLAVGAAEDAPNQSDHCSGGTGPTADGRRKPDLYAPGCSVTTPEPWSGCGFETIEGGTSIACAVASGAALLVRQYFVEGFYPNGDPPTGQPMVPSGALIKAVLVNSAADMTDVAGYPSDLEGWGRILLDNTLHFSGDERKLWIQDLRNAQGLSTGAEHEYSFNVAGSAEPLRVTLVFTEPAASVSAGDPVVNNLDLEVSAPGGSVYKGNWFSGGQSATGGSFDAKNNVEQVHRTAPATGTYTLKVKGTAVNEGTQGYALVVSGDIEATFLPPDCNGNGTPDSLDIGGGTSQDCQGNQIPDDCETLADCNDNQVPDTCESLADCNSNGVPDECEPQLDCNGNGIPDFCDGAADCNGDGVADTCNIQTGESRDCQPNGQPDECEVNLTTTVYTIPEGVSIPNGSPSGVSRSYWVADHRTIMDLDVHLQITHGRSGDVLVKLSHGGVTQTLIDRPGYPVPSADVGFLDTAFNLLLDDEAEISIETYTEGGYTVWRTSRPSPDPLYAFNGQDAYGEWTINVADVVTNLKTGTFNGWSLHVSEPSQPVPGCFGPGDCTGDGDVDLEDLPTFEACLSGPGGGVDFNCGCADIDGDGDIDLADFGDFQEIFTLSRSMVIP